jgi:hypothetical protein
MKSKDTNKRPLGTLLLWHPESDCLFEGSAHVDCEDVTDIAIWEYRWALQDLLGMDWHNAREQDNILLKYGRMRVERDQLRKRRVQAKPAERNTD